MYLKRIVVKDSKIQGEGVFAAEDIHTGEVVWKFDTNHDLTLSEKEFISLPEGKKELLNHVAYLSAETGRYIYPPDGDPARYTNHDSEKNNLTVVVDKKVSPEPYFIANRNINEGEELTNNYNEFDAAIKLQTNPDGWLN
jgi:SET domain-containing protein